jgi:hypothetical protein
VDVVVEQVDGREGLDAALRPDVQAAIAAPERDEPWRAELTPPIGYRSTLSRQQPRRVVATCGSRCCSLMTAAMEFSP